MRKKYELALIEEALGLKFCLNFFGVPSASLGFDHPFVDYAKLGGPLIRQIKYFTFSNEVTLQL